MSDSQVIADDAYVRRHPRAAFRELGGAEGGVLLQLDSGGYHGVNQMGCLIWELMDGGRTVAGLITAVRERVEAPPSEIDDEVRDFVAELVDRGLVEVASAR
ncbi:MAG TPA: PqqD family protein [Miltoncostaeaceae bacterium]|nr:PqqD family protein [Miltoncostaeaceae bacterium]